MQVVHFEEITGRDREDDIESNRRHKRTFQALTDTANGGADRVLAYAGVPLVGDLLTYTETDVNLGIEVVVVDDTLVAIRRRAEQQDGSDLTNWTVTVEYAGIHEPEAQPAEVEFSPTRYQEHFLDDVNGVAVVNSAGDPPAEGAVRDRTRFTLTISKNVVDADWDPIEAEKYQDTLNLEPFLAGKYPANMDGFAAGTCKLTMSAKRVKKIGLDTFYWARTAVIDIDTRGWNVKLRDAGFRARIGGEGDAVPIIDAHTGHSVSAPRLLDNDGAVLPAGSAPKICNEPDGFAAYRSKDWAPLALEY